VLPVRIFNNSFVQFEVEKDYFGIDILQRHLTLTEMDLVKCRGKDILICPADHAVYSTEINSCELSLFQSTNPQETCGRRVTSRLPRPRFERFGSAMLYYLPGRQTVYFQCQRNRTSETTSLSLQGSGLLLNAARCSFTSKGLQMTAALQGESQYFSPGPILFTPIIQRISSGVEAALKQMASVDRTGVERLVSSISSHHMDEDVNTLLHLHDASQEFVRKSNGVTIRLIAASTVLVLFILYYFTQAYWWNVVKSCAVKRENAESESVQKSQCAMPPLQPSVSGVTDELSAETQARFSAYSMQTV
jgi:hypothetical protein